MLEVIEGNKEWLFSGIGVALLAFGARAAWKYFSPAAGSNGRQIQQSGSNSVNIQAGTAANVVVGSRPGSEPSTAGDAEVGEE